MTDERFDRELRVTVQRLMDVEAPGTLRADVDLVLAGETDVRRYRTTPGWLRFGLAAAAVAAIAAVVGLGVIRLQDAPTTASSGPTVAATASPVASSALASSAPTFPADWVSRIGMPVVQVPANLARHTTYPWAQDGTPRQGLAATGPYAYRAASTTNGLADVVNVIDLGGGSITPISVPLQKDEIIDKFETADGWLVVVATTFSQSLCRPSEAFRILVTRLGSDGLPDQAGGGFKAIANGTMPEYQPLPSDSTMCWYLPPAFDVAAGRLAWADAPVVGAATSTIHLVTLDGSASELTVLATRNVVSVTLSDRAVAWIESSDVDAVRVGYTALLNQYPKTQFDWRVSEASLADPVAHPVDIGEATGPAHPYPPQIVLDGSAVVATRYQAMQSIDDTLRSSVVRVDASGITVIDDGRQGRGCVAGRGAVPGIVAMQCWFRDINVPMGGAAGTSTGQLALAGAWTPADGLRAVVEGSSPDEAWAAWAETGWMFVLGSGTTNSDAIYSAYPLSLLTAP